MATMLQHVLKEPEQWFTACMQLVNYMLKHPKALLTHKVQKEVWLELLRMSETQENYRFYEESLGFCLIRLGSKFLSLKMLDEALFLAFESKIPQLLQACKRYAVATRAPVTENLIEHVEQKVNPGTSSNLVKAMSQIANFSGKQLRKEDYNNLFKDFETLIKIDDITDLELKDFNGWEIDLERYQKAIDLEFEGNFAAA